MIRLFRVFIPLSTVTLLISELLLVAGSFVLGAYVGRVDDPAAYLLDQGMYSIGLVVLTIVIGLYLSDLYTEIAVKSVSLLARRLCLIMGAAFVVEGVVSYLNRGLRIPLHIMIPGSFLSMVVLLGWRVVFSRYVLHMVGSDRLLLVGSSSALHEIAHHVHHHPDKGLQIVGVVDETDEFEEKFAGAKYLGRFDALRSIVDATRPSRIVVGMYERRNRVPVATLLALRFAGNVIEEAPSLYERLSGRVSIKELRPSQLIYSGQTGRPRETVFYQALFNMVVTVAGIIISLPLMVLTSLAVKLTTKGPIFYRQVRVGKDGVPFTLYKFRSMRVDAEAATGAVWASREDPRVTPVGRIIRKIRFDELPQLFNVLKGEMAIVGPRPERPEFVKTLVETIPYYQQRHSVRPGITGWAQINYKYGDTFEDTVVKLEYDLYYIKNMAVGLDAYIIFHTLKAMLLSRGSQ